jgi:hypothetical protein
MRAYIILILNPILTHAISRMLNNRSQQNLDQYYKSLNEYKDESWFRLPSKMKKRSAVRKMKGVARDANQNLRQCVDVRTRQSIVHALT